MNLTKYCLPEYYYNRELSWLQFNFRVLGEAKDRTNPLFERLKFLSITASNLDEFYMVRVASLKDMVHAGYTKPDVSGLRPNEQLKRITEKAHSLVHSQYNIYQRSLLPLIRQNNISILRDHRKLSPHQINYMNEYFQNEIYPVLTPMAVDSSRPFPLIRNKTLNIGALICNKDHKDNYDFATVQVPGVLPRLVQIPSSDDKSNLITYIPLEIIIMKNLHQLFLGYHILCAYPYRIIRSADLTIEEDEAADLLTVIQNQLKKRQWGQVIRLEVDYGIDKRLLKILKKELKIKEDDIFYINGPLDLTFLMKVYQLTGYEHLKQTIYHPILSKYLNTEENLFTQIRRNDIFLHHPYDSFESVIEFIGQSSIDPNVLAIKQTLYRVSSNSPIISSLATAAENGKQVSVLVELKARFDEENNIQWARKLEQAGCHVIYGLKGLKTHSKITLVVRKEDDGIRRYVHLGTGNYNDSTAKLYTDMGLLTCSEAIGQDATAVFNMISGYSEPTHWYKLTLSPYWLRDKFLWLIRREKEYATKGKPSHIIAKMNSLSDTKLIEALYDASSSGVKIDLIVRGICCLKTGIKDISENITVRSIVGTFLEHTRIFYFYNSGSEEVYLSSADWMPRNLDKRVELLFPVENQTIKQDIIDLLKLQLNDTVKSHIQQSDGSYVKVDKRGKPLLNSQDYLCSKAKERLNRSQLETMQHQFIPLEPPSI